MCINSWPNQQPSASPALYLRTPSRWMLPKTQRAQTSADPPSLPTHCCRTALPFPSQSLALACPTLPQPLQAKLR